MFSNGEMTDLFVLHEQMGVTSLSRGKNESKVLNKVKTLLDNRTLLLILPVN